MEYGGARDFFSRFNVSVGNPTRVSVNNTFVDYETGKIVSNYVPPNSSAQRAALEIYLQQCELYENILLPGYWNFPSPDQIPSDLLLQFGQFAKKHGIEAALPQIFTISGLGVGNPIAAPTLYVMQAFGAPMARALLGGIYPPAFVPLSRNNSELYGLIEKLLDDDVIYSSVVVSAKRNAGRVKLTVRSKDGKIIRIEAKRLLIAFEPTLENMDAFDLDATERGVFSKWQFTRSYASIVTHPSLPISGSLANTPAAAAPSNYLEIPSLPYIGRIIYLGTAGFRALIGGSFGSEGAKKLVRDSIDLMVEQGTLPATNGTGLQFVAFADHGPMHLRVSSQELSDGMYPLPMLNLHIVREARGCETRFVICLGGQQRHVLHPPSRSGILSCKNSKFKLTKDERLHSGSV